MATRKFKIICPYCSEPFTPDMENAYNWSTGCDTCGSDSRMDMKIICSKCNRLVYKKTYGGWY